MAFRLSGETLAAIYGAPRHHGSPGSGAQRCGICSRVVSTASIFLDVVRAAVPCRARHHHRLPQWPHALQWRHAASLHCSVCGPSKREILAAVGGSFI